MSLFLPPALISCRGIFPSSLPLALPSPLPSGRPSLNNNTIICGPYRSRLYAPSPSPSSSSSFRAALLCGNMEGRAKGERGRRGRKVDGFQQGRRHPFPALPFPSPSWSLWLMLCHHLARLLLSPPFPPPLFCHAAAEEGEGPPRTVGRVALARMPQQFPAPFCQTSGGGS